MNQPTTSPEQLISLLEPLLDAGTACALAFDADGTLWSGDVGEDVFRFAVTHRRLREAACAELQRQAEVRGFERRADVNAMAQHLFEQYVAGRYPERDVCEMMTWCYAGHTQAELRELVMEALDASELSQRLHDELRPVLDFVRSRGVRTVVISASPRATVEQAARLWGFGPEDIAASTPRIVDGIVLDSMAGAVPYAAGKVAAGRALLAGARWIASFGDNVFDLEMLQEAEIGVAVRPKPALQARLPEIAGVLWLSSVK